MSSENSVNEIDSIRIMQLNVNSLISNNKKHEFSKMLLKHKPHVALLSETKLKNKNKIDINKYKIYRNDRSTDSGGGTAICVVDTIVSEYIAQPKNIKSIESCTILIKLENNAKMYFTAIYKPPRNKLNPNDLDHIINIDKNACHMIAGDFNSHHPKWGDRNECMNGKILLDWYETNHSMNIKTYSSKYPTCHRSELGSFIDFGFLFGDISFANNENFNEMKSDTFSDHSAVFIEIRVKPLHKKNVTIKDYTKADWSRLKIFINVKLNALNIPSNSNITHLQINDFTKKLNEIYAEAIDTFIPNLELRSDLIKLSNKSEKLLKEKKKLLRKKHRNRNSQAYTVICNELKNINKLIFLSIKNDYSDHWEKTCKNIKLNSDMFKNIKKISNYKRRVQMPNVLYEGENKECEYISDDQKANALASQFEKTHKITSSTISVMEAVVNDIYDSYDCNEPVMQFSNDTPANFKDKNDFETQKINNAVVREVHDYFLSRKELQKIIKEKNNKKSCGSDRMCNYVIKKLPPKFIDTLVILANHIINSQYFPEEWKFGLISPILKANRDNQYISNYRPITQSSAALKIIEKKIDNRLRAHCDQNNLLSNDQYGFRPKRSTELAASIFISNVARGLNEKKATLAILLDFCSAFDTIWHKGIIYKMHLAGFDRNLICIIKNYLENRTFIVKINEALSEKKQIAAGCPQGSVISAILFIIYINDFPSPNEPNTQIKKLFFADDAIIYSTTNKIKQAQISLNKYLNKIYNYTILWKLKLNNNKCESISIVGSHNDTSRSIRGNALKAEFKINNTKLKRCDTVKYLGIQISKDFKFIKHIDYIIKKINISRAELRAVFENKYIVKEVKIICYKQLIRPIILYASSCWLNLSSHQMERLRKTERWFLRYCSGLFRDELSRKYISSKRLYEETKTNRIDRKLVESSIDFVNKIKLNQNEEIKNIANFSLNYLEENKYKQINYFHSLNESNILYNEQNILMHFNIKANKSGIVYPTSQNSNEIYCN